MAESDLIKTARALHESIYLDYSPQAAVDAEIIGDLIKEVERVATVEAERDEAKADVTSMKDGYDRAVHKMNQEQFAKRDALKKLAEVERHLDGNGWFKIARQWEDKARFRENARIAAVDMFTAKIEVLEQQLAEREAGFKAFMRSHNEAFSQLREQLAEREAVIEKVREVSDLWQRVSQQHDQDDTVPLVAAYLSHAKMLVSLLASSPQEALAEAKADVWDEAAEVYSDYVWSTPMGKSMDAPLNPYRKDS